MKERFEGERGRERLRQALLDQQCIANDIEIANALLPMTTLEIFQASDVLLKQGATDNDLLFILSGRVAILVNEREIAKRGPKQHVGEMALIETSARRSATIVADEETVVARIGEPEFSDVARKFPQLWRRMAQELAQRLRDREVFHRVPNAKPVLFIGSSVEGLKVAKQIQVNMSHSNVTVRLWTDNVFEASAGTMESLERTLAASDFAVLVLSPDDRTLNEARKVDAPAPRDNVLLELGMCFGMLSRARTFFVVPRGVNVKMPTDLLGVTALDYRADDEANLQSELGPVCTKLEQIIRERGVR